LEDNKVRFATFLSVIAVCAGSLLAQSAELVGNTIQRVTPLAEPYVQSDATPAASAPAVMNILTIMGPNVIGPPCYNCITGGVAPNIGLLSPSGIVHRNVRYQVDVFVVDNSYTGACTFTIEVVNKTSGVIVSTNPTFNETAPTSILLGTAFTIPSTAPLGPSRVTTSAVCGTSTTKSASPIYILR
jgi:hypothetical protein